MNIRLERGLRILILLQTGARYDAMKLARELGVTRRTIFRDIAMLKDLGLVIEYDLSASSYCVKVPSDESIDSPVMPHSDQQASTRSLNAIELGRALQPALSDDLTTPSSMEIIRQIAMNLAEMCKTKNTGVEADHTQMAAETPESYRNNEGPNPSSDENRVRRQRRFDRMENLLPAPHVSATAKTIYFDKTIDQVCYLNDSIVNQQTLRVWNRVEQRLSEIKPTELHFVNGVWSVTGATESEVINLNLSTLEVVYEFQPS